jgi:hypothetical protein
MKRTAMAIIVGAFIYAAGWALASYILPKKAPHTWFRVQTALGRLEEGAAAYHLARGAPPEAAELNKEIAKAWIEEESWIDSVSPDLDENIVDILYFVSQTQIELRKFDQPPRYIVDSTLPNGCGFVWTGEDRMTTTNGRDPDDINSWDKSSDRFYYERFHRRTSLRNLVVAMPCALIAALIVGRKRKRPTSRGWEPAISTSIS